MKKGKKANLTDTSFKNLFVPSMVNGIYNSSVYPDIIIKNITIALKTLLLYCTLIKIFRCKVLYSNGLPEKSEIIVNGLPKKCKFIVI